MSRILGRDARIEIVGEGSTISETIQKVHELRPDILLLDLHWFGDDAAGIGAIERLRSEVPDTKIIAISVYPNLIEPARNAGAMAALNKEVPMKQLIEEICSVHALSPPPSPPPLTEALTKRELQVLALMAEGKTDKEIAQSLSIAESTAKNHVGNIMSKLNAPNRTGAVSIGYQRGLVG